MLKLKKRFFSGTFLHAPEEFLEMLLSLVSYSVPFFWQFLFVFLLSSLLVRSFEADGSDFEPEGLVGHPVVRGQEVGDGQLGQSFRLQLKDRLGLGL